MGSLDDFVALLLQRHVPCDESELRDAIALYRSNSPLRSGSLRRQVNLSACLYLEVTGERLSEPRVRLLGGWGSRNDLLADIALFHSGERPETQTRGVVVSPVLSQGASVEVSDALQIATLQGLDAARKSIEASVSEGFSKRLQAASDDFSRRTKVFEDAAAASLQRQEAAEAQRLLLERKFDEVSQLTSGLTAKAAALEASLRAAEIQNSSLIETLARERAALDASRVELADLGAKNTDALAAIDRERRQQLLNLEAARQSEIKLDKVRANLEQAAERSAQKDVLIAQLKLTSEMASAEIADLKSKVLDGAAVAAAISSFADTLVESGDLQFQHQLTLMEPLKLAILAAASQSQEGLQRATGDILAAIASIPRLEQKQSDDDGGPEKK